MVITKFIKVATKMQLVGEKLNDGKTLRQEVIEHYYDGDPYALVEELWFEVKTILAIVGFVFCAILYGPITNSDETYAGSFLGCVMDFLWCIDVGGIIVSLGWFARVIVYVIVLVVKYLLEEDNQPQPEQTDISQDTAESDTDAAKPAVQALLVDNIINQEVQA